ncbi:hypothetical protein D3C75_1056440 [compost metagenome]
MCQTISALIHFLIRIGGPFEHKSNSIRLLYSKRLYPTYNCKLGIILDVVMIPINKKLVLLPLS